MTKKWTQPELDELVEKGELGELSKAEIALVMESLKAAPPDPHLFPLENLHLYPLLFVLGLSGAREHRATVEKFLRSGDTQLVSLSLEVLCRYWRESVRYIRELKQHAYDVSATDPTARVTAITLVGEHLSRHSDRELLEYLLTVYGSRSEEKSVRLVAYIALATAVDHPVGRSLFTYQIEWDKDLDPTVIEAAQERLKSELP